MKPLDILSAIPLWKSAAPGAIFDSPAFALQSRIGEEQVILRPASIEPAESDMLALSVAFGDDPHSLLVARSPRFPELDQIWESRSDLPEPILLALVEKECGPLFQMLENAVRKQLRLVGLGVAASGDGEPGRKAFEIAGADGDESGSLTISLTRSQSVVSALGNLRNLDLAHESIRSQQFPAVVEYAAFAAPEADLASLEVGDSVLIPELGAVKPKLIVDGRFVVADGGVALYVEDALVRVISAEPVSVSLGEVFDAVESGTPPPAAEQGMQLCLMRGGRIVASGRLGRLADQTAFEVES